MKTIIKVKNIYFYISFLMLLTFVNLHADEFDELENIVSSAEKTITSSVGSFGKIFLGFLPLICIVITTLFTLMNAKKKSEQEQDSSKIYIAAIIGIVGGGIIGIFFLGVVGLLLMGGMDKGFEVTYQFWKDAFKV